MKIQMFHQQIHGHANIDYFGSPKYVDGRPFVKNFKSHAKAPQQTTQKHGDTIHKQYGSQMFETMVIQQSLIDHLEEELTTVQEFQLSKTLSSTKNGMSVGGSQFIVGLQEMKSVLTSGVLLQGTQSLARRSLLSWMMWLASLLCTLQNIATVCL
jgi:hypothetical protein